MSQDINVKSIHFEKVNTEHLDIIFSWLDLPHMREFWDNSQEHRDDIINFINGRVTPSNYFDGIFTYWVGLVHNEIFCIILTAKVTLDDGSEPTWKEYISKTGNTYSIDFGIGNINFLGKGLAAPALELFAAFFQEQVDPLVDTFFIDPDEGNPRAKHVYEKAGFRSVADYKMKDGVFKGQTTHLMVLKKEKQ